MPGVMMDLPVWILFIGAGGEYEKIYAFEPCKQLVPICQKRFMENNIERYELIEKVCWSEKTEVCFETREEELSASYVSEERGKTKLMADSIDNILARAESDRVTFIKMDIEGSELEALKGAEKSIIKWRPRLAISIYHKPEDILEIPAYLLGLVPDYNFYIRHYSSGLHETVLYAY